VVELVEEVESEVEVVALGRIVDRGERTDIVG
jgi:hypothetical protein